MEMREHSESEYGYEEAYEEYLGDPESFTHGPRTGVDTLDFLPIPTLNFCACFAETDRGEFMSGGVWTFRTSRRRCCLPGRNMLPHICQYRLPDHLSTCVPCMAVVGPLGAQSPRQARKRTSEIEKSAENAKLRQSECYVER